MRAASTLMQFRRVDDGSSAPWDEEGTCARREPARGRGIWATVAAVAAAGLLAVAGALLTGRGATMGLTASADVQLADTAYSQFQYTGCRNWQELQIDRMVVQNEDECATKCNENPECGAYNWQREACEPGWYVDRGCLLFKAGCKTEVNTCWKLAIKPSTPPVPPVPPPVPAETTVRQQLTMVSTASAAEIQGGVAAALAEDGVPEAQVVAETQAAARRLDGRALAEAQTFRVTWTKKCTGDLSKCSFAFEFAKGLLTQANAQAFHDKVVATMPTGTTLAMTATAPSKVSTGTCDAGTAPPFEGSVPGDDKYVYMTMAEAKPCLDLVKSPAKLAKQTVMGLKAWYEAFYAFAYISKDPPAGDYTFSPLFKDSKLGIFGAEGGGAPPELSKVDLLGGLQAIADGLPEEGDVPAVLWTGPVSDLFNSLRDAHVNWANGRDGLVPQSVWYLNSMFKITILDPSGNRVALKVQAADPIAINGAAVPVVTDGSGRVVESIGGMEPLEWLLKNIVEVPTFQGYVYKSIGARVNALVMDLYPPTGGLMKGAGETGSLEKLTQEPPIPVKLKNPDGSTEAMSWQWGVVVKVTSGDVCTDPSAFVECMIKMANTNADWPGKSAGLLLHVGEIMMNWTSTASKKGETDELLARQPAPGPAAPLLGAEESTDTPWPDIFGDGFYAEMPVVSGFLAFQKDADGQEYGIFKIASFEAPDSVLGNGSMAAYAEVLAKMRETWDGFNREATKRKTERLLIDVVSNGGGTPVFAWEIVQWLFSDLPYRDTCGTIDRPIPDAYNSWKKINYVGLQEHLPTKQHPRPGNGLVHDRIREAFENPAMVEAIISNTNLIIECLEALDVLRPVEKKVIDDALAKEGTLERLKAVVGAFEMMWNYGYAGQNPFALMVTSFDPVIAKAFDVPVKKQRGGTSRDFSSKWLDCAAGPPGEVSVFKDIIIVSDGLCGSSCYMFAGGSRAVAKLQSVRSLRTLTYGGVGGSLEKAQETLSPTSFPGGNVNDHGTAQIINPVLKILLIEFMLANVFGLEELVVQLGEVWDMLVSKIPYFSAALPKFTQSELYMAPFSKGGAHPPPDEYIFYPTDMYLPEWFNIVQREQWKDLYMKASAAFSIPAR